jgi:hypothetical protein
MKNVKTFEEFVNESNLNEMMNLRSRTDWTSLYTLKIPQEKVVKLITKYTDNIEWANALASKWRETSFMNNVDRWETNKYGSFDPMGTSVEDQQKTIEKIRKDPELEKLRTSEWEDYMKNKINIGESTYMIGDIQKIFLGYNSYGFLFEVKVTARSTFAYAVNSMVGEIIDKTLNGNLPKAYNDVQSITNILANNNNNFKDYVKLTDALRRAFDKKGIIFSTGRA